MLEFHEPEVPGIGEQKWISELKPGDQITYLNKDGVEIPGRIVSTNLNEKKVNVLPNTIPENNVPNRLEEGITISVDRLVFK